jgi:hypothetical protein
MELRLVEVVVGVGGGILRGCYKIAGSVFRGGIWVLVVSGLVEIGERKVGVLVVGECYQI